MRERSASQSHFNDLCAALDEPTPTDVDPTGDLYCFDKGATKDSGSDGWADVWKKDHFAWEYKGKRANLDEAFIQLRQYLLALNNPPLLIVCDMNVFRIVTNWTNCVSERYEFSLDDLLENENFKKLKWAMSDPEKLRPQRTRHMVTEEVAGKFANLAQSLRNRGNDPVVVAHFINRLVFCMFAEDVGLLPEKMFSRMLEGAKQNPHEFQNLASQLFEAMSKGGLVGFEKVDYFNGGLFDDETALGLTEEEIKVTISASKLDWSEIDPSILGTLFERGLDPAKRAQLGAHYTDREKIQLLIDPVIVRPLMGEWSEVKTKIESHLDQIQRVGSSGRKTRHRNQANKELHRFLQQLREFTVLDPACGSGNFLFLALHALKDIEHQSQLEAEALGLQRQFPSIGPENVKGIEINEYAAELARLSIWIGEIQWMLRNGFNVEKDPILKPLDTIECRNAILSKDDEIPDWPSADVVIGNPPFLGNRRIRNALGDEVADLLPKLYHDLVYGKPDLVCYWFARAGMLLRDRKIERFGFVATNSIRGGTNRKVLDTIVESASIFEAWSDEPWIVEGAAVRVSLICINQSILPNYMLNGREVDQIHTDLTAGVGLTKAVSLLSNKDIAFQGDLKRGSFEVSGELARNWLVLRGNPNGKPNSDVLKPWFNGKDITDRPKDMWIVDFGDNVAEEDAAMYEEPFEYIRKYVKPDRLQTKEEKSRTFWFRHWNTRPGMWKRIEKLSRYIATPRVSKHRVFVWCDTRVCPDSAVVAIARDDDTTFGILHSRFHEAWALRLGTSLTDRPRYTPVTTFRTFPFPEGLSPDVSAELYQNNAHAIAIAKAARELVEARDRWLFPEELIQWSDEVVPGYPKRPIPTNDKAKQFLKKRTLTQLYNSKPTWLENLHQALDEAVAKAYGWNNDITEEESLQALLDLNLQTDN